MAKFGVRLKIDVTKILKQHLFEGAKGKYLDATVFLNVDEKDQYDNNGMITQSWKDQDKGEGPILGNAQVFWRDDGGKSAPPTQGSNHGSAPQGSNDFEDDIPFAPVPSFY